MGAMLRETYFIYRRNLETWLAVPANVIAPLFISGLLFILFGAMFDHRLTDLTITAANATGAVIPIAKVGHVQLRHGNTHQVATLATDHLPVRYVVTQVLANLPAHDLSEAGRVTADFCGHDEILET